MPLVKGWRQVLTWGRPFSVQLVQLEILHPLSRGWEGAGRRAALGRTAAA